MTAVELPSALPLSCGVLLAWLLFGDSCYPLFLLESSTFARGSNFRLLVSAKVSEGGCFLVLLDRTLGRTLDRTFDQTLGRTLDRTFDQTLGRTLDRTLGRTLDQTFGRTLDQTFLDQTFGRTLDRTLGRTLDRTLGRTLGVAAPWVEPSPTIAACRRQDYVQSTNCYWVSFAEVEISPRVTLIRQQRNIASYRSLRYSSVHKLQRS